MTDRPSPDLVFNQVPALAGYDLAAFDAPLLGALDALAPSCDRDALHRWGAHARGARGPRARRRREPLHARA